MRLPARAAQLNRGALGRDVDPMTIQPTRPGPAAPPPWPVLVFLLFPPSILVLSALIWAFVVVGGGRSGAPFLFALFVALVLKRPMGVLYDQHRRLTVVLTIVGYLVAAASLWLAREYVRHAR